MRYERVYRKEIVICCLMESEMVSSDTGVVRKITGLVESYFRTERKGHQMHILHVRLQFSFMKE